MRSPWLLNKAYETHEILKKLQDSASKEILKAEADRVLEYAKQYVEQVESGLEVVQVMQMDGWHQQLAH